ncbi:MAG: MarR family winged helix-turn-helix transcriptional regulator [Candidatus Dormibacteria bacterium]
MRFSTIATIPRSTSLPRFGREFNTDPGGNLFDQGMRDFARDNPGHPWVGHPDCVEPAAALLLAARLMRTGAQRAFDELDLSDGRFKVLVLLSVSAGEGVALGDVAGWLDVSARNVTGLVDQLEHDGLVERVHDSQDRRVIRARLTDAGRAMAGRASACSSDHQRGLMQALTAEERVTLRHLCLKLARAARGAE